MSVEDWARREAAVKFPKLLRGEHERYDDFDSRMDIRDSAVVGAEWMAVHAFSALLSDKAVEAVARAKHKESGTWVRLGLPLSAMSDDYRTRLQVTARAYLQAAVAAVTEGDTE